MAKLSAKFLQALASVFPGDAQLMEWATTGDFASLGMILFGAGVARHPEDIIKSSNIPESEKPKMLAKINLCHQLYQELYKSYYKP